MFVSDYAVAVFDASNSVVVPNTILQLPPNLIRSILANRPVPLDEAWQLPGDITFTPQGAIHHMSLHEQRVFSRSLRSSVKIVARGKA